MNPEPLEVELLASEDARRLAVAISAPRPIPDCPIEALLADIRRIAAEKEESK